MMGIRWELEVDGHAFKVFPSNRRKKFLFSKRYNVLVQYIKMISNIKTYAIHCSYQLPTHGIRNIKINLSPQSNNNCMIWSLI